MVQVPWGSLLHAVGVRLPGLRRWEMQLIQLNNRLVARYVAKRELGRCNLVHGFSGSALEYFREARKKGDIRCVLDLPSAHINFTSRVMEEEARRFPAYRRHLSYMGCDPAERARMVQEIELADAIFVGSQFVADSCLEAGVPLEKLWIAPYGADLELSVEGSTALPRAPFRVLFAGSIMLRKGIHYLLEAWKRERLSQAELLLLGELQVDEDFLRPYQGLFRHIPRVPRHEVGSFLRSAHVFVLPSLVEGSAIAVYEAMAAGLSCIVTPNTGSVVRDGVDGFVVPIRDMAALADCLRRLYNDRMLARRMGESARERIKQFTWQDYRRRVVEGWRRVLEGAPLTDGKPEAAVIVE
jgi:glycosyltransferase involved in cell wall biosynthesis